MKRTRRIGVAACCLGAFIGLTHVQIYAQDQKKSEDVTKVAYEDLGAIDAIWEAEHRLGGTDRIFLIEDSWELNRCAELLPKLPKIDVEKELLLIVMSWSSSVRTLKSIEADADTLVISVVEAKPPLYRSGPYQPPEFLVFKLPAWKGPVRVVINERPKFIIHRGDALQKRTNDIWEEILRLHSGGRPTLPQQVRRYQRMWPENSEREIKQYIMENKERFRREEVSPYYEILFRDLVNTRAKPAIPRIFSLIESMGKHDKALGPATGALVGIGGPEVVEQCKIAIKSWNPQSRSTAWGLLARFATPDMRELARENVAELDRTKALNSLNILKRIGIGKEDVPYLVHGLDQVAKYYARELEPRPMLEFYDGEVGQRLIHELGELGPDAAQALPVLERFATDTRLPLKAFQKNAQEAIDKIKNEQRKEMP